MEVLLVWHKPMKSSRFLFIDMRSSFILHINFVDKSVDSLEKNWHVLYFDTVFTGVFESVCNVNAGGREQD